MADPKQVEDKLFRPSNIPDATEGPSPQKPMQILDEDQTSARAYEALRNAMARKPFEHNDMHAYIQAYGQDDPAAQVMLKYIQANAPTPRHKPNGAK